MDELDVDALRILKAVAEEYRKVLTLYAVDEGKRPASLL